MVRALPILRQPEYKALLYRILLAYVFYFVARTLFALYNSDLILVTTGEFLKLAWHGLAFDTTAILYVNGLFILLSVLPTGFNTHHGYQTGLKWLYFVTNLLAMATNFVDFIYYRYIFSRTTVAIWDSLEHETNKSALFSNFLINYWHVFALFFVMAGLWIWLYNRVKVPAHTHKRNWRYFGSSTAALGVVAGLAVGGIRGDFKKSTRPINLLDANRYVTDVAHADIVLNTPFAIIRTFGKTSFKKVDFMPQEKAEKLSLPVKHYPNRPTIKPNIVLFILESYGREYVGSFNKDRNIPNYRGYTPFIDSLATHSLIFTEGYANGYKSIHGMSSILSGVPSFKDAFTSSPYPRQDIQSLVSVLKDEGYYTAFFHGAPNGSMGFLGFANILGFDRYFGKTEYNNDADFDGVWGIWDEPYFQYYAKQMTRMQRPFFTTVFSVSSHEPYEVPDQYNGRFPKGDVNIHQTIGYTDHAIRKFFETAKKQPWYQNTIFVIVADHGNTIYYDEYKREGMKNTVPIMFFTPSEAFTGVNHDYAQQIDIYPTLLDMIGYKKPFRSWGRSLLDTKSKPFVVKYGAGYYQFMQGDYICTFDGQKAVGFYHRDDKGYTKNLIGQRNSQMDSLELRCKAFLQDYMYRVIDKKLGKP